MSDDPMTGDDIPSQVQLAVLRTEMAQVKGDVKAIKSAMFFVVASIVGAFIVALVAVLAKGIT